MLEIAPAKELRTILQERVGHDAALAPVADLVCAIADTAMQVAEIIALGRLAGESDAAVGNLNSDGDAQKKLDMLSNDLFVDALGRAPVAVALSEELEEPLLLDPAAPLAIAIDPLDGSSNINANVSLGTIFSVLPVLPDANDAKAHFLQPGRNQLAAGFVIYGPQCSLVLAFPDKTSVFTLDRRKGTFRETIAAVQNSAAIARICDQHVQLPALGAVDTHFRRRLRERHGRPAGLRPQHALDRFAGRRGLPHPVARRRVSVPG